VQSSYSFTQCDSSEIVGEAIVCETSVVMEVDVAPFYPPFSYSGQCASALLQAYIPVFIYMCCFQTASSIIWLLLVHRVQFSFLPLWIRPVLQGAMWPEHWARSRDGTAESQHANIEMRGSGIVNVSNADVVDDITKRDDDQCDISSPIGLLNVKNIIAKNAHALALSLSFGLCCPYLALAIGLSVLVNVLHLRYITGSFLFTREKKADSTQNGISTAVEAAVALAITNDVAIEDFNSAVAHTDELLQLILWPLVWSSALFVATVCFDMSTDEVGWRASVWIPITTICVPIAIWICVQILTLLDAYRTPVSISGDHGSSIKCELVGTAGGLSTEQSVDADSHSRGNDGGSTCNPVLKGSDAVSNDSML
jgi:hypothetical protein